MTLDDVLRDMGLKTAHTYKRDTETVVVVTLSRLTLSWSVYVDKPQFDYDVDAWVAYANAHNGLAGEVVAQWVDLDPIAAQAILYYVFSGEPLINPVVIGEAAHNMKGINHDNGGCTAQQHQ